MTLPNGMTDLPSKVVNIGQPGPDFGGPTKGELPQDVIEDACALLSEECNYFVNGRCDLRKCMMQDEKRALVWPPRFFGCRSFRVIEALRALTHETEGQS
jgi:hypothetical protein